MTAMRINPNPKLEYLASGAWARGWRRGCLRRAARKWDPRQGDVARLEEAPRRQALRAHDTLGARPVLLIRAK